MVIYCSLSWWIFLIFSFFFGHYNPSFLFCFIYLVPATFCCCFEDKDGEDGTSLSQTYSESSTTYNYWSTFLVFWNNNSNSIKHILLLFHFFLFQNKVNLINQRSTSNRDINTIQLTIFQKRGLKIIQKAANQRSEFLQ